MLINDAFKNNEQWSAAMRRGDSLYFERLALEQRPEALYIGCSDSRVTAEDMMGAKPGELFVHRNIANLVPNSDDSSRAVINFAVDHLKVKHIVVCGHYGCGGVAAAIESQELGKMNAWLKNIRDVFRLHRDELDAIDDASQRYERLVELNVQEQCLNVLKISEVQRVRRDGGLQVHGWVFDIRSGRLRDLNIDIEAMLEDVGDIYRIS